MHHWNGRINLVLLWVFSVPPKIDNDLSSKDIAVAEGSDVTLVCNVTGIPQPTVHWHRQPLGQSPGKHRQSKWYL